jgi:holo-[acyl-carrier protein] synthase
VGVDIVDVERIRGVMERVPSFLTRVFTDAEREYCNRYADPAPHYAARFAAKEAAFKALSGWIGALRFQDYEVQVSDDFPHLKIGGRTWEEVEGRGICDVACSLAHEKDYAIAVVSIECEREEQ